MKLWTTAVAIAISKGENTTEVCSRIVGKLYCRSLCRNLNAITALCKNTCQWRKFLCKAAGTTLTVIEEYASHCKSIGFLHLTKLHTSLCSYAHIYTLFITLLHDWENISGGPTCDLNTNTNASEEATCYSTNFYTKCEYVLDERIIL